MPDRDPLVPMDGRLAAWVAGLAADESARARARTYWLRRQAEDEGTFVGVLADLADRRRAVVVHLHNGRRHRGEIRVLGADFIALETANHTSVIVHHRSVASVRTAAGEPATVGDRSVVTDVALAETLGALAEERPRVLLIGDDATDSVRGELRRAGRDVLTVRLDGDGGTAYVPLSSVAEISLAESG